MYYISDDVPVAVYIGVGIAGSLFMLIAILTLVIGMVVWCTKKYKTSRNDADRQEQYGKTAEKFTELPVDLKLKGTEAYDCTLNDLIPTAEEDVMYDEAILHKENVAYGCIYTNQIQEKLDMKGNEAYGCTTSDLIPTGENVAYGQATPINISTRGNIAYGHVAH